MHCLLHMADIKADNPRGKLHIRKAIKARKCSDQHRLHQKGQLLCHLLRLFLDFVIKILQGREEHIPIVHQPGKDQLTASHQDCFHRLIELWTKSCMEDCHQCLHLLPDIVSVTIALIHIHCVDDILGCTTQSYHLSAQSPGDMRILSVGIHEDNVPVGKKCLQYGDQLRQEGLSASRNAQHPFISVREQPPVDHNLLTVLLMYSVWNTRRMVDCHRVKWHQSRLILRRHISKVLNESRSIGKNRIEPCHLLESHHLDLAATLITGLGDCLRVTVQHGRRLCQNYDGYIRQKDLLIPFIHIFVVGTDYLLIILVPERRHGIPFI